MAAAALPGASAASGSPASGRCEPTQIELELRLDGSEVAGQDVTGGICKRLSVGGAITVAVMEKCELAVSAGGNDNVTPPGAAVADSDIDGDGGLVVVEEEVRRGRGAGQVQVFVVRYQFFS